jgi:hypothetical protein
MKAFTVFIVLAFSTVTSCLASDCYETPEISNSKLEQTLNSTGLHYSDSGISKNASGKLIGDVVKDAVRALCSDDFLEMSDSFMAVTQIKGALEASNASNTVTDALEQLSLMMAP